MLTKADDFPIHQTSEPVAHTNSSDRNFYDRYFFNGYARDGSVYFAAALGSYPNRHVTDAAVSVSKKPYAIPSPQNMRTTKRAALSKPGQPSPARA